MTLERRDSPRAFDDTGSGHQRYPVGLGFAKAPKEIVFSPAVTGLDGSAFGVVASGIASDAACIFGPGQGTSLLRVAVTAFACQGDDPGVSRGELTRSMMKRVMLF